MVGWDGGGGVGLTPRWCVETARNAVDMCIAGPTCQTDVMDPTASAIHFITPTAPTLSTTIREKKKQRPRVQFDCRPSVDRWGGGGDDDRCGAALFGRSASTWTESGRRPVRHRRRLPVAATASIKESSSGTLDSNSSRYQKSPAAIVRPTTRPDGNLGNTVRKCTHMNTRSLIVTDLIFQVPCKEKK